MIIHLIYKKKMKILANNIRIDYNICGKGPPLLLLHGYPQTKIMWRKMIPILSKRFTLVLSDLRGYGQSDKPKSDNEHITYSKRQMARDQVFLMRELGYKSFYAVGHDRGARVFHRAALDFPKTIKKLVLIDIVPTSHIYNNLNKQIAESFFHWFFLSQKKPIPENLIINNKKLYIKSMLGRFSNSSGFIENKVLNEYIKRFSSEVVYSSCEDYRAGSSIDLKHHKKDTKKISCPTLVLWGKNSLVGKNFKTLTVWKEYCKTVNGYSINGGHFLPEENPKEVSKRILKFL